MSSEKVALITGITGQDGSYLAELLLDKGYSVHGVIRRSSSFNTARIDHLYNTPGLLNERLFLHYGDVVDTSNLNRLLEKIDPDEIYNLAAQSHVKVSFEIPEYTAEVDAVGTLRFLDAIRETGVKTRFYQASTSELYGKAVEFPQNEKTPFHPRSPYSVAKLYGYWIVVNYREAYRLFACNGVLFNHESPKRGETFVTRKITRAAARIALGLQNTLVLGNLDGESFNRKILRISCWQRGKHTLSENLRNWPFVKSGPSCGGKAGENRKRESTTNQERLLWKLIHATTVLRRLIFFSGMPAKRGRNSDGIPRRSFRSSYG